MPQMLSAWTKGMTFIRPRLDGELLVGRDSCADEHGAWQLPANAGEQVLPVETGPRDFLPYMILRRIFAANTAMSDKVCRTEAGSYQLATNRVLMSTAAWQL